jgi:AbiV family abortive infection protein
VQAGSFPRALALATLSWEEVSKADLCALALALPEITSDYFWKHFRDHEVKLARVHAFAALMSPEQIGPMAGYEKVILGRSRSTKDSKERALYVDYRRGKVLLPSQIGERAARNRIKVVREALDFAEKAFTDQPLATIFTKLNPLLDPLKNALAVNPDAVVSALRSAMLSGSQEKLQSLLGELATIPHDNED